MRGSVSAIEAHPQKKAIIDCILARVPQREIARRFGMSQAAVHRFIQKAVKPALTKQSTQNITTASSQTVKDIRHAKQESKGLIALESTAALLERKWSGIERMKQLAETKEDIGGWASLDRAETAALQLRAQLAGELAPQASSNIQVAILIPPPPASGADGCQVIDVDARQVPLARDEDGRSSGDNSDD